ncbi:hypothetical protein DEA8626_03648 [Defluviimonas aquaemixtae]|uniref:Uncharacterized protein n=1 Tax=Albidovulum aquaemixtae TaxID=1542388 RepID=A0A2R8BMG0_9RHOB|nr:hypothetical protein [Defluviimonas aquaemixtae]SPH24597.1 hypothetical protein DEA8626_03648 [Defluviimonas aquaemixtae]
MVDRNLQNFHGRIGRIERIHNAGGGFEAEGALGMSYYKARHRPARRFGLLGPIALVLIAVLGIKAAVYASLGAELYEERIAALRAGTTADQVGAYVLQADPITVAIAERIRAFIY